jgi:hypothetical protein
MFYQNLITCKVPKSLIVNIEGNTVTSTHQVSLREGKSPWLLTMTIHANE